jgi:hypothetical protein
MRMEIRAEELQPLKESQINTPTWLRCCRTKSLSSPQTLGILEEKFQHCHLLQREFRPFRKKSLL